MTTGMSADRRAAITQKTVARWRGRPFRWGKADCGHLALAHVEAMGHRPDVTLRHYRDALGAARALKDLGVDRLPALLDRLDCLQKLPAPAFALPGDLVALPADDGEGGGLGAICIYLGNGAVLGWHPDADGCEILIDVRAFESAWKV